MIHEIIKENQRRHEAMHSTFDPITGEGSIGVRCKVTITGLDIPTLWLPEPMLDDNFVGQLVEAGSVAHFRLTHPKWTAEDVQLQFERCRCLYDFPFWCASFVYIKCKGGGEDCLFRLTYPQRKFVERLERLRLSNKPIRIVLLKARQWGGSTTSQLYMAWLQLVHATGLNSLIIAHQGTASDEIKDMFDRMIARYPRRLLYDIGTQFKESDKTLVTVGRSGSTFRVPQRNTKIKIGTAERPNGCRGGDYNLVHLSEVGIWKATQGKKPEEIVRSACAGIVYRPNTMIVYESTANGIGNFFHREYIDARDNPRSQFESLFISWFEIEQNQLPFASDRDLREFAQWLIDNRNNTVAQSHREESGQYLWWLWQKGATLEGINWYITERAKVTSHGSMAAECPTDDTEAFVNSGAAVFDKYRVESFRKGCRKPRYIGEVEAGDKIIEDVHFVEDSQGSLSIWTLPDSAVRRDGHWHIDRLPSDTVTDRYLTVVDVGGRADRSDWSVIAVFDRLLMMDGGKPQIVAQWRGHCDIDLLAWRAARIAAFYENALLVIESNTLETHDQYRMVDGDQSHYILNEIRREYPHLYARRQSEEDIRMGMPRKYGFHTNISTKPMIISTLVKAVREQLYTERDEQCLNEYLVYERKPNGAYGAIIGEHDDILMTRAIGLHICFYEMPIPQVHHPTVFSQNRPAISAATL